MSMVGKTRDILGDITKWFKEIYLENILFGIVALFLVLLVGVPLIFFLWGSVWSTEPGFGGHFTLRGYENLLRPQVVEMFWNTVIISVAGTITTLLFAIFLLFVTIKTSIKGSGYMRLIIISQYLLPSYLLAFGWDLYVGLINKTLINIGLFTEELVNLHSLWGIALVGAAHYTGLVYLFTSGAIESVPSDLEESAMLNGASKLTTFFQITLKLALPSIAIAIVLVFTRFAQAFGFPIILGLPADIFVIATMMYTFLVAMFPPRFASAAAMGVILLVISIIGLVIQRSITGPREKYETVKGTSSTETLKYDLGRSTPLISFSVNIIFILIFVGPLGILLMGSLLSYGDLLQLRFTGFSIDNYIILFAGARSDQFYSVLKNSLFVAGVGAFLGMIFSSFISYIIVKGRSDLSAIVDIISLAPVAIPGIVVGVSFLWLFLTYNFMGLYGTLWLVIIGLTSKFVVYGTRATNSSFRAIGDELEEAATLSGANIFGIFRHIFIPLIKPGFIGGYMILFVDYLKVLTIPVFLTDQHQVLATYIFFLIEGQQTGLATAASSILILIVAIMYGIVYLVMGERSIRL